MGDALYEFEEQVEAIGDRAAAEDETPSFGCA